MKIELKEITAREVADGYLDGDEEGVVGYGGLLDIRPKYQREFVYDKILQARRRLLGELEVQPDATGLPIAGAPPGLHPPDAPLSNLNTQNRLPFFQKRRDQFLELGLGAFMFLKGRSGRSEGCCEFCPAVR